MGVRSKVVRPFEGGSFRRFGGVALEAFGERFQGQ
jgi:hypothetical protein